jgi:hypothetical protein
VYQTYGENSNAAPDLRAMSAFPSPNQPIWPRCASGRDTRFLRARLAPTRMRFEA